MPTLRMICVQSSEKINVHTFINVLLLVDSTFFDIDPQEVIKGGQSYVMRRNRRFHVSVPFAEFEATTARKIDGLSVCRSQFC
jgi:hypothetical protein